MPAITLKEGDFGVDKPITFDLTSLYLPDPAREGLVSIVPLTEIADIEAMRDDNSERFKSAAKLSAGGLMTVGPIGLAAGLLAARHGKEVVFSVRLHDERTFVAVASAAVYADLHAAQVAARAEADGIGREADEIIAKYLHAPADEPEAPPPTAKPQQVPATPIAASVAARPVFGRRGR